MRFESIEMIKSSLYDCKWFAFCGHNIEENYMNEIWQVRVWSEAQAWSGSGISNYCVGESANFISSRLSVVYESAYSQWNNHIDEINKWLEPLIDGPVKESIPQEYHTPEIFQWIKSLVRVACMEIIYGPYVQSTLCQNVIQWFLKGHFPCGWIVDRPESFPQYSRIVVL